MLAITLFITSSSPESATFRLSTTSRFCTNISLWFCRMSNVRIPPKRTLLCNTYQFQTSHKYVLVFISIPLLFICSTNIIELPSFIFLHLVVHPSIKENFTEIRGLEIYRTCFRRKFPKCNFCHCCRPFSWNSLRKAPKTMKNKILGDDSLMNQI